MKKVIFIMSLVHFMLPFAFIDKNVSKNSNYTLFEETVTYYETTYENNKVYKKEIPKDKYKMKVQEAKGDSGYPRVKVNCTNENSEYCEGSSTRETGYTTLRLRVYLNPNNFKDGFIKVELTWDVVPTYRLKDYISISFDGTNIRTGSDLAIKGYQIIDYISEAYTCPYYCYGTGNITRGREVIRYDLVNTPSVIKKKTQGLILEVDLKNDDIYYYSDYIPFYKAEKIVVSLETKFRPKEARPYNTFTSLKFAADYRHSYRKLTFDVLGRAEVYIDGPSGGLGVTTSLITDFDDSRYTSVNFIFN